MDPANTENLTFTQTIEFLAKFLISPGLLQHNQALPYIFLKRDKKTVLPKVDRQRRVSVSDAEHFFSSDMLSSIALFGFLPFLTAAAEGKVSIY